MIRERHLSTSALCLVTVILAGGGCELIAGLKDRAVDTGGAGGTTTSAGGGGMEMTSATVTTSTTGGGMGGTGGAGGMGGIGGTAGNGGMAGGGGTGGMGGGGCGPDSYDLVELLTGEIAPTAIALDSTTVYWTTTAGSEKGIYKLGKADLARAEVIITDPKTPVALAVSVPASDGFVYWSEERAMQACDAATPDADKDRTMRIAADGSGMPDPLHSSCGKTDNLTVYSGNVYVARATSALVQRLTPGDPSPLKIFEDTMDLARPFGIAVDSTTVFFTDVESGRVQSCPDGALCSPQPPAPLPKTITSTNMAGTELPLAADGAALYWTTATEVQKVDKYAPANTVATKLGDITSAGGIALDEQAVYVTDPMNGQVLRFCKDPGPPVVVATGQGEPRGIAVDSSGVYWVNKATGEVMRATGQ